MTSSDRIGKAIERYIDYFDEGIPVGFHLTLKNPDDHSEWEQKLGEAIEKGESLPNCEGVF